MFWVSTECQFSASNFTSLYVYIYVSVVDFNFKIYHIDISFLTLHMTKKMGVQKCLPLNSQEELDPW